LKSLGICLAIRRQKRRRNKKKGLAVAPLVMLLDKYEKKYVYTGIHPLRNEGELSFPIEGELYPNE
jgi:hypothetical protein